MSNTLDILYVEDCEITVELFKMSWSRYSTNVGLSIDVAGTVSEAKEIFCSDKHVVALIDWNLPDGKGTDVALFLRNLNPTLPIVFLSAQFTDDLRQEAYKFSDTECLEKNFKKEYIEKITQYIRAH